MKKILIIANSDGGLYSFRKELIEKLLSEQCRVFIAVPKGEKADLLVKMGCILKETVIDKRGKNPFKDIKLILRYKNIVKTVKPDVVLTYTIKPNIYGGIICKKYKIPYIANITGLGTAVENNGILSKLLIIMYRKAFKSIKCVFCQNGQNYNFLKEKNIAKDRLKLIPGSGVNLEKFKIEDYPPRNDKIRFLFIGRVIKEKGIEEYLQVAKKIKEKFDNIEFGIIGQCKDEKYINEIANLERDGVIKNYGEQDDVRPFIEKASCIIHPTFYPEGMSNVLLEASATGRPIITTNRPGCKEIVDEEKTGFLVEERNTEQLIETVEKFINLPYEKRKEMGINARKKVEKEFDRNVVINKYMKEISNILEEKK